MKALVVSAMIAIVASYGPNDIPKDVKQRSPSPLLGTWSVDVARMPVPAAERPKRVTTSFSDAGGGKWTMRVEIAYGGDAPIRAQSTFALDGAPVPAVGTPEADTIAAKQPAPNVLVVSLGKDGQQASTRIYSVQPDGRTMIETATYYRDGAPVLRTNYFTRSTGK